jgi:hypothetical protein
MGANYEGKIGNGIYNLLIPLPPKVMQGSNEDLFLKSEDRPPIF